MGQNWGRLLSFVYGEMFSLPAYAAEEDLAEILVCYADMGIPGVNKTAGELAAGLDPRQLS